MSSRSRTGAGSDETRQKLVHKPLNIVAGVDLAKGNESTQPNHGCGDDQPWKGAGAATVLKEGKRDSGAAREEHPKKANIDGGMMEGESETLGVGLVRLRPPAKMEASPENEGVEKDQPGRRRRQEDKNAPVAVAWGSIVHRSWAMRCEQASGDLTSPAGYHVAAEIRSPQRRAGVASASEASTRGCMETVKLPCIRRPGVGRFELFGAWRAHIEPSMLKDPALCRGDISGGNKADAGES